MIVLRDLHFSYGTGVCVFASQAFEVTQGGFYSLFGKSGCGKTTLGQIVAGLLAPNTVETMSVAAPVLYATNEDALPPWIPVSEHLASVIDEGQQDELQRYFEAAGLDPKALERLPSDLSHGQRQRSNLARFLFQDHRILVLDEALSNVDQPTRWSILKFLKKRASPETIIYLSHELQDVILFSDTIYGLTAASPTCIHSKSGLSLACASDGHDPTQFQTIRDWLLTL
jgi:ABC-type nitrate/sulfonate/bicarbonate transport system ATPase subunit